MQHNCSHLHPTTRYFIRHLEVPGFDANDASGGRVVQQWASRDASKVHTTSGAEVSSARDESVGGGGGQHSSSLGAVPSPSTPIEGHVLPDARVHRLFRACDEHQAVRALARVVWLVCPASGKGILSASDSVRFELWTSAACSKMLTLYPLRPPRSRLQRYTSSTAGGNSDEGGRTDTDSAAASMRLPPFLATGPASGGMLRRSQTAAYIAFGVRTGDSSDEDDEDDEDGRKRKRGEPHITLPSDSGEQGWHWLLRPATPLPNAYCVASFAPGRPARAPKGGAAPHIVLPRKRVLNTLNTVRRPVAAAAQHAPTAVARAARAIMLLLPSSRRPRSTSRSKLFSSASRGRGTNRQWLRDAEHVELATPRPRVVPIRRRRSSLDGLTVSAVVGGDAPRSGPTSTGLLRESSAPEILTPVPGAGDLVGALAEAAARASVGGASAQAHAALVSSKAEQAAEARAQQHAARPRTLPRSKSTGADDGDTARRASLRLRDAGVDKDDGGGEEAGAPRGEEAAAVVAALTRGSEDLVPLSSPGKTWFAEASPNAAQAMDDDRVAPVTLPARRSARSLTSGDGEATAVASPSGHTAPSSLLRSDRPRMAVPTSQLGIGHALLHRAAGGEYFFQVRCGVN